jgi:hypothetical protein
MAVGRFLLASCALGALLVASPARADDRAEAEALITKGVELREKGRDDEALVAFRKAWSLAPSPRARAQVALAEQALGMWVVAEVDLAAALASEADGWIAKNRAPLEGALGVIRKHLATLEVRGAENAEVYLDGLRVGTGAGPFRVEAGRRTLEVRAAGLHAITRAVEIPAGGIARETVTLVPAVVDGPARAPSLAREGASPPEDPGGTQRLLGWVFAGSGVALAATGGVGLLVRKGIVDDYNAACPGLGAPQSASCDEQVSSAQSWLTLSVITLAGGTVLAGVGIVLVASAPPAVHRTKSDGVFPRLSCRPGLGGITCTGVF